jgi:hypothetical protein
MKPDKPTRHSKKPFPVKREYARCAAALKSSGIVTLLPKSKSLGVIGIDGKEYPMPTREQVVGLFTQNRELENIKVPQGFDRLELTPLAMPILALIERLKAAIVGRAAEGKIHRTRRSRSGPLVPIRVNAEKQVWIWERLKKILDTDEIVYFPREHSGDHHGQTKREVIHDSRICAVSGWSVGLVESAPMLSKQSRGKTLRGRKQLEIGSSPREYLSMLQASAYRGETGKTQEDFLTSFLARLETSGEISHDRSDDNGLWLLGQYVKRVERLKGGLVPTGWWIREFGRLRLDAHRPGNKLCTRSFGASTVVRLPKP